MINMHPLPKINNIHVQGQTNAIIRHRNIHQFFYNVDIIIHIILELTLRLKSK